LWVLCCPTPARTTRSCWQILNLGSKKKGEGGRNNGERDVSSGQASEERLMGGRGGEERVHEDFFCPPTDLTGRTSHRRRGRTIVIVCSMHTRTWQTRLCRSPLLASDKRKRGKGEEDRVGGTDENRQGGPALGCSASCGGGRGGRSTKNFLPSTLGEERGRGGERKRGGRRGMRESYAVGEEHCWRRGMRGRGKRKMIALSARNGVPPPFFLSPQ